MNLKYIYRMQIKKKKKITTIISKLLKINIKDDCVLRVLVIKIDNCTLYIIYLCPWFIEI